MSETCKSFNNSNANIKLQVQDINDTWLPQSDQVLLNFSQSEIVFTVKLVDISGDSNKRASEIYQEVSEKTSSQYTLNYSGSLTVTEPIQQMLFITTDSTNCWSNGMINYSFDSSNPYLNVSVTPNNCNIDQKVKVQLQYYNKTNSVWNSVLIEPYTPTDGNSNGYYTNSDSFVYSTTKHFVQYLSKYTNQQEQANMQNMFYYFLENRDMRVRLVVTTTNNNNIDIQYSYEITNWTTPSSGCYTQYYVYQSAHNLTIDIPSTISTSCKGYVTNSEYIDVTLFLKESDGYYQQTITLEADFWEYSDVLYYKLEEEWPLNLTNMTFGIYLDYYKMDKANNKYIYTTEMALFGTVLKTCISKLVLKLDAPQICVDIILYQPTLSVDEKKNQTLVNESLYCVTRFNTTQNGQLGLYVESPRNNVTSRIYYFYSSFVIEPFTTPQGSFCFREQAVTNKSTTPGSFQKRAKKFVKIYDEYPNNVTAMFMNGHSGFFIRNIIVEMSLLEYSIVVASGVISIVSVCLSAWMLIRRS